MLVGTAGICIHASLASGGLGVCDAVGVGVLVVTTVLTTVAVVDTLEGGTLVPSASLIVPAEQALSRTKLRIRKVDLKMRFREYSFS